MAPLTLTRVLSAWTPDAPTIAVMLILVIGYAAGMRAIARQSGAPWPRGRVIAFAVGVAVIGLTGLTFVGVYADTLFWVRAVQVIALLMVVPLCLALGAPVALAMRALPPSGVGRLERMLASTTARVTTFPATASVLLIVTPWLLYFTGWYPAVLADAVVDHLTRLVLLAVGFLYFYSRLQLDPVPHKYPHLISVVITFVEVIFDAALGLVLWLDPHIVANSHYLAVGRTWGPSLRLDQIIGAGVLWLVGDLAGLPFLGALMNRMSTDDAVAAQEIDRQLDAEDERRAAMSANSTDEQVHEAARPKLWWEDDPVLAQRFKRRG
jgi:cytochrome c oxidase assembly factor CtaG